MCASQSRPDAEPAAALVVEPLSAPPVEVLEAISRGLEEFNREVLGDYGYERVAVVARGPDGDIVGGVFGDLLWDWLYIQCLWVDPRFQRQLLGSRLLQTIEAAAVERGFTKAHLETTSFQARAFYERQGYTVFGVLEGKPAGVTWYYLKHEGLAVAES